MVSLRPYGNVPPLHSSLHPRIDPPSHRQQEKQLPVDAQLQHAGVPQGHAGHWVMTPLQLTCPLIPEAQSWFWNVQEPPLLL
jgi:hypothetical protein